MIEKYGVDLDTVPPSAEQLKQIKSDKKPATMKEANEMIDKQIEKEAKESDTKQ